MVGVTVAALVTVIAMTVGAEAADGDLYADLYSSVDGTGDHLYTKDYIPDFTKYISGVQSVCGAGAWLVYESDDYGAGGSGQGDAVLVSDSCKNLNFTATSVRQAGSPVVFDRSVLTLYAYTHFRGREFYITTDLSTMGAFSDQAYSAVVTGSEPWTVYTYASYGGYGKCLHPDQEVMIGGTPVGVGLFPTYQELGSAGLIRSVRRGCFDEP